VKQAPGIALGFIRHPARFWYLRLNPASSTLVYPSTHLQHARHLAPVSFTPIKAKGH
jgi:hypothetical protein